jgi:dipeptidyl aminopeptidase/acylaminoacyl peptidase
LVAQNIAVLQMADAPHVGSPENPENQLAGYEAAIDSLSATGLVDRSRVGVIGFSYTCYQVLYALTHRPSLFKAAAITDGNTMGYMQYMLATDSPNVKGALEIIEKTNGGAPFDGGLSGWIRNAPDFNLDKVATPLLISALENDEILAQWETYAGLRILKKPVDMMWMREANAPHVLIEPRQRYFSQQTAVDWFVFWLNNEEDVDPGKSLQYDRWRRLRDLQHVKPASDAGDQGKR